MAKWWAPLLPEACPMVMRRVSKAVARRLVQLGVDDVTDRGEVFRALAYTPAGKRRKLLGSSSKVRKGKKLAVLTRVMYIAPARLSGVNMCAWSTAGCAAACLGHSTGMLQLAMNQRVLVAKALLWHLFPDYFLERLDIEIRAHIAAAERLGLEPAIRLNGSSDVRFERHINMAAYDCIFYDYTKAPADKRDTSSGYHLTYSVSERADSEAEAMRWIDSGGNAAMVVAAEGSNRLGDAKRVALKLVRNRWRGCPTVDGDETDVRYRDKPGSMVVLYAKGAALRDTTGFVKRSPV